MSKITELKEIIVTYRSIIKNKFINILTTYVKRLSIQIKAFEAYLEGRKFYRILLKDRIYPINFEEITPIRDLINTNKYIKWEIFIKDYINDNIDDSYFTIHPTLYVILNENESAIYSIHSVKISALNIDKALNELKKRLISSSENYGVIGVTDIHFTINKVKTKKS